jgi:hypothetical protein
MQPTSAAHEIFRVNLEPPDSAMSVYAVRRPDQQWALLAINKDPMRSAKLDVRFKFSDARPAATFAGKIDIIQFSREQYVWRDDGPNGRPIRSLPPKHFERETSAVYELPPYSLSVLRGRVPDS